MRAALQHQCTPGGLPTKNDAQLPPPLRMRVPMACAMRKAMLDIVSNIFEEKQLEYGYTPV